jgi:tRNA U34 5-carboxymethylaminomethyl modifying GTPase MnmE/TrmE
MVPTTAVLTVVRGGVQPACKVVFRDGTTQALSLPNLKINHFLDEYLTATNADANRIKEVQIRIPGRLQSLDADIVDTPGVNDIDVMREEVTFQHLKHADAVIVILDAQQPVSQSEREFLSNHVKPSDVSKMLFVLNRIDERIATVDDCSIESVERYAEERLRTLAGIAAPVVYGLSAKSTLRARFRSESDAYSERFAKFEDALVSLASRNATQQRLLIHLDRVLRLCQEQCAVLECEAFALSQTVEDSMRRTDELQSTLISLQDFRKRLPDLSQSLQSQLAVRVARAAEGEVELLRRDSCAAVERCDEAGDYQPFRSEFSWLVRRFLDQVEKAAWQASRALKQEVLAEHRDVLKLERPSTTVQRSRLAYNTSAMIINDALYDPSPHETSSGLSLVDGLGGGTIAMILQWLFPGSGLIQMIGGLVGGLFAKGAREGNAKAHQQRITKVSVSRFLNENLDRMETQIDRLADDLARQESDLFTEELTQRLALRNEIVDTSLRALQAVQSADSARQSELLSAITARLNRSLELVSDCDQVRQKAMSHLER